MSGDNCLVCATDEGVFVDIEKQPELKDKAKICRLDKVWEESESTKICHKCAFEIGQCSEFIEKVKKSRKTHNAKKDSCVLCFDTQDDKYLFDLSKQKNGVNGLIQRLRDQFSDELKNKELKKQFICLSCRYCIDLLADLQILLDEVPSKLKSVVENGIDAADLPKTKTIIASRKTTYIKSDNIHLNTPSDTDSDTSSIMTSKKKVNKKTKSSQPTRKCGQCKEAFANDADTYRLFKTGKTLCKQCWLSTDFNKTTSKKRKKVVYPATQLCSVVLKDLYQTSPDDEYTIVVDNGKTTFKVTTSESSHVQPAASDNKEEEKTVKSLEPEVRQRKDSENSVNSKTSRQRKDSENSVNSKTSRQRKDSEQSKHEEDVEPSASRQRKESEQSEHEEEASVKQTRATRRRKDSEQSVQESIDIKPTRAARRRKDSEQSVQEVESRPVRSSRRRIDSEQSVQEDDEVKPTRSRNRKNSEQSVQSVDVKISSHSRRRKDSEKSEQEEIQIDDVDSDNEPAKKRAKKSNTKTESVAKSKVQKQSAASGSKRKRGRSSSIESTDSVRKSARNAKKHEQALEEIIEIDDLSDTDKVEKELTRPKRSRRGQPSSHDEHSDGESDKDEPKISSPMPSKEPTPERQPESPSNKETEDSTNVTEVQINEPRSKELESSESEEIDILKSTDEESKHDESLEKRNASKIISDVDIDSEHDVSDKSVEKPDDSISKAVEDPQLNPDENEENHQNDVEAESVDREETEIFHTKEKSVEKDMIEDENKDDDEINVSKDKSDMDDQDLSDDGKENKAVSKKRTSKKNARKSKSTGGKKSRKSKVKSSDDIAADSSDSEQAKSVKEPIVTTYTCNVCKEIFNSKFEGLQHEITHAKSLKISLEKVEVPEKKKTDASDRVDEKMDVDEDEEIANEAEKDEDMEKTSEAEVLSNEKENEDVEMAEVNANKTVDFDRIDTVNEDEPEFDKTSEHNESETEVTPNKRGRRASSRRSKVVEEKREKKTRGRRKTSNDIPEPEVTTAIIETEPDKISEVVQETLNDIAELHEKVSEENASKDQQEEEEEDEREEEEVTIENQEKETETEDTAEKEQEVVSNDEPEVETVESESETEAAATQNPVERVDQIETHDIADDSSRDEVICDSNDESRDAEPEEREEPDEPKEPEHPVVNLDDEASGDVVDVESESKKRSEESEIEITEVEDVEAEGENNLPDEVVECEQVDLTEKDDTEDAEKPDDDDDDDDNDIQEITQEPDRNIHEDENTVDSVTEINVMAAAEPTVENDAENPRQNDDEDNTTEEEVLAQESLEDILQRKGLQVVDEFAESVTDGDDESEKEANVSSEKESTPRKKTGNNIDIKITEPECTEIVEIANNKTPNKKSVDGEVQITQDVDVVEEVVNDDDDDVQPQSDAVEEVEVDANNVSFNFPKLY